jgi:hypothetical protein
VGNCSAQSLVAKVTTPALADNQPPSVPTAMMATPVHQSQVNLSWQPATDNVAVSAYRVYRNGTLLATLGNLTEHSDSGLRAASTYSYTVSACDVVANCSAQTAAVMAVTPSAVSTLNVPQGWNLLGNASDTPIDVGVAFSDSAQFVTLWKWLASQSVWAFYSPALAAQGGAALADYAAAKGYQVLRTIAGGEGFWVNVKQAGSVSLPLGSPVSGASLRTLMLPGWNLVATADNATPAAFNLSLTDPLAPHPAADVVPINLTTLWAWDNPLSKWYFYSPQLEGQSGTALFDYTVSKGYLDFAAAGKTLGTGVGFWINKP